MGGRVCRLLRWSPLRGLGVRQRQAGGLTDRTARGLAPSIIIQHEGGGRLVVCKFMRPGRMPWSDQPLPHRRGNRDLGSLANRLVRLEGRRELAAPGT
jgi:hypothetical protein